MVLLDRTLPPLIVDSDASFIQSIQSDPYCTLAQPMIATTGAEAQTKLADRSQQYSGIFINPNISSPSGLSVIRCAHLHRSGTPIFMICDEDANEPFTSHELKQLAVHHIVRKPVRYSDLVTMIAPLITMFDAEKALSAARQNTDPVDVELSENDKSFVPILAENFLSGRKSFFDLYVRLRSGKYVMILKAGDAFSGDRLLNYIRKGVYNFYLRKEAQSAYLDYCTHLSSALLRSEEAPAPLKAAQIINMGEETMKYLLSCGVSEAHLNYARQFTTNMLDLMDQFEMKKHKQICRFLSNAAACEHGVGTAIIAALLVHPMQIQSDRLKSIIGIASFLHDIALAQDASRLEELDESQLNGAERELYRKHPEESARILGGVRGMDAVTLQAISQHHLRRDGSGFPEHEASDRITRVAEIVGICDEFVHLIRKSRRDPTVHPLQEMENKVFHGFTYPVIAAFRSVFMRKE